MSKLRRRGIEEQMARRIIDAPQQRFEVKPGRELFQSVISESGKNYLVRIFVDVNRVSARVVTGYRTSKIEKYWRKS
ncbi:MAG TPA: hypothetical protein VGQ81_03255 [Acidobacteriota bacterium]|nr:hypothetical protein [Acidobacteriota bacterium]